MESNQKNKQNSFLKRINSYTVSRISILGIILLTSIVFVNCTPTGASNAKTKRAESTVQKSQENYQSDIEKFKSQINSQITQNNIEIKKLKGQFSDDDKANNKKLKKEIKVLNKKDAQLKHKLNDYNAPK